MYFNSNYKCKLTMSSFFCTVNFAIELQKRKKNIKKFKNQYKIIFQHLFYIVNMRNITMNFTVKKQKYGPYLLFNKENKKNIFTDITIKNHVILLFAFKVTMKITTKISIKFPTAQKKS